MMTTESRRRFRCSLDALGRNAATISLVQSRREPIRAGWSGAREEAAVTQWALTAAANKGSQRGKYAEISWYGYRRGERPGRDVAVLIVRTAFMSCLDSKH